MKHTNKSLSSEIARRSLAELVPGSPETNPAPQQRNTEHSSAAAATTAVVKSAETTTATAALETAVTAELSQVIFISLFLIVWCLQTAELGYACATLLALRGNAARDS